MLSTLVAGEPSIVDVLEATTQRYRAILLDDSIPPQIVPAASLTSFLLTLYTVLADGSLSYFRQDQNILNANNVTIDANGVFEWIMQPTDLTIVQDTLLFERHVALFEWSTTSKTGKHELWINVKNLVAVP